MIKETDTELELINMNDVPLEEIEWLWYPYIAYGKLTIMHGNPGDGKTNIALKIAAQCTTGEVLPGQVEMKPITVIYQTAEDGLGDTIKPRLIDFYYSLTKFMLTYGSEPLKEKLCFVSTVEEMNSFIVELIQNIEEIIKRMRDVSRKNREVAVFKELLIILSGLRARKVLERQYSFQYDSVFIGLTRFLCEEKIRIETSELIIDEENEVLDASKNYNFESVKCGKSNEKIELRLSDWIASFVGRMMNAICSDPSISEKYDSLSEMYNIDVDSKHLLSEKWFEITRSQYDLYMKVYQFFVVERGESYWTTMTGDYFDATVLFYSLLRYFSSYNTYDDFMKVSVEMHREYYNSAACQELERHYQHM